MEYRIIKQYIDKSVSLILFIILSPLFLYIFLVIRLDSSGPILFVQKRIGKGKKVFNLYKFRTMKVNTPQNIPTHKFINSSNYITKTGKFLRKTSLDELPQLLNILLDQMSIIGPRPALWNQYDLIHERDRLFVNSLKPGLTGWAQINGRDELPISIKAMLDGEYVKNISFKLDIKCFFLTIEKVLKRDGIIEGVNINNNSIRRIK